MHRGQIILGVSSGTMMNELAWAATGMGAWINGQRLAVRTIASPDRAAVSTGNPQSLALRGGGMQLGGIGGPADSMRGLGGCYD